jgi:hypothetical protein
MVSTEVLGTREMKLEEPTDFQKFLSAGRGTGRLAIFLTVSRLVDGKRVDPSLW